MKSIKWSLFYSIFCLVVSWFACKCFVKSDRSLFLSVYELSAVVLLDFEKLCFNFVEFVDELWEQLSPLFFLLFSQLFEFLVLELKRWLILFDLLVFLFQPDIFPDDLLVFQFDLRKMCRLRLEFLALLRQQVIRFLHHLILPFFPLPFILPFLPLLQRLSY